MLAKIWNFLFYACKHHWEIKETFKMFTNRGIPKRHVGTRYILRCSSCGKMKMFEGYNDF